MGQGAALLKGQYDLMLSSAGCCGAGFACGAGGDLVGARFGAGFFFALTATIAPSGADFQPGAPPEGDGIAAASNADSATATATNTANIRMRASLNKIATWRNRIRALSRQFNSNPTTAADLAGNSESFCLSRDRKL